MRVGIDIRVLAHGVHTGVEAYTISLLERLFSGNPEIEFRLFYNAWRKAPLVNAWTKQPNVLVYYSRIPNRFLEGAFFLGMHPRVDRWLGGTDVFFSPHIVGASVSPNCPRVLTVHDLSFLRYPEFFSFTKRLWHAFLRLEEQLNKAARIIAVSHSTRRDLAEFFKIKPEKISVIYPGVEKRFCPLNTASQEAALLKEKYRLPKRFILFLGTIEPRKNIPTLIRAFTLLRDRSSAFFNLHLVIAGRTGWLERRIFDAAAQSPYASAIHFPGFVAEQERPLLFNLAELFVYPSIFEGFGFPPLEAMACGIPTIVSNRSSLPEVVGGGALLIDPYDPDALAEAMKLMLLDSGMREHYRKRGIVRSGHFSWNETAQKTAALFGKVSGR